MTSYADRLEALVESSAERCTTCGKCFEACPTVREIGLDAGESKGRVGELLSLTREGGPAAEGLSKWLNACDGSARCSDACPEGINVRQWVTIAKLQALQAERPAEVGATNAANRFRHMAQAVRLLASMQLPSETLKRILAPAEKRRAEVLFYTGCNVLRTPHIVLNVMDILDGLGLDFDVVGGTAHCCGVYQFQEADLPTYERIGHRTFQRLGQSGAARVLTWCPTCTKNFDELEKDAAPPSFDLGHVSEFLAGNLDELKRHFLPGQPRRRVVIHEHLGIGATLSSMHRLLSAVPNLELLTIEQDSGFSYACGGQAAKFKDREQAIHRALAEGAIAAGADTIVVRPGSGVDTVVGFIAGTDTIDLTAFTTQLLLGTDDRRAPVVFTGSMRPHSHAHPDGPGNLRDAVAAAAPHASQTSCTRTHGDFWCLVQEFGLR